MSALWERLLPRPILTASLIVLWLLLNNSLSVGQILLAILIGLMVPPLLGPRDPAPLTVKRPFALLGYVLLVLYDIVIANFIVARQVLGRNSALKSRFLIVPLAVSHPTAISLFASTITLTPGTVSCEISADRSHLIVHALHSDAPDAEIASMKERYERRIQTIFGEEAFRTNEGGIHP